MITSISIKPDPFLFWAADFKNLIAAIVFGLLAFYAISPVKRYVFHPNVVMMSVPGNVIDSVLPVTFLKHK
jgi:hypothetical protein